MRVRTALFMVCLGSMAATGGHAQTLSEAVTTTLATNPGIQAGKYNVDASDELMRQARGGYFPTVDLVLATGRENSNNTTTRAQNLDELRLTRQERSLRLTQLLWDGGSTQNLVKQQAALNDAAIARLVSTQETVGLAAIQAYLEVLRRDAVVRLAEENLGHHDSTLGKIRERFESGVGTRVDVVQTEGRRAQSRSNVLLSQRDARNGRANFFRIVGEQPAGLSRPEARGVLPTSLEAAISIAARNNPGLKAAEAELEAAIAAQRQARGTFHPRFDLELGATRNDDTDGTFGANDDETAVIRMTYNLYRGGADRARLRESAAREMAARESVNENRRIVEENVTVVWNELEDIRQRLEFLKAHVNSTEEVLEVYNEQLSLGKRTLLDLLDVQNELLRAKVAATSGEYTALLAHYRVLASTGALLSNLGLESGR